MGRRESVSATSQARDLPLSKTPVLVLDTNVVLDLLLFRDRSCASLVAALQARQLTWICTEAMRAELASVLPRTQFKRWQPDTEQILRAFDECAVQLPAAPSYDAAAALRCRDADDQKFIDLACAAGARWLLTRDRALLDLAKGARILGVGVLHPTEWTRRYGAELHADPSEI